ERAEAWLMILSMISMSSFGGKSYTGPCGGRDCSGGCQCFPEKGARVSNIFSCRKFFMPSAQYHFL
uniref:Uncharacterized protein n=1 Tax=Pavo cristatus TaxID=9049 RepID=A0A8C9F990_PAVCR